MRFDKLGTFWWRERPRRVVRAPKLKSKLLKLEREIGGVADRIARDRAARRGARKPKNRVATFFSEMGRSLPAAIEYSWYQIITAASSARRVVTIGVRAAPTAQHPKTTTPEKNAVAPSRIRMESRNRSGLVLASICFGLVVLSGVIIALLFLQIKDMKGEIARWQQNLSATQSQLRQVEKTAQQKVDSEVKAAAARARHVPIALTTDESKAVRASIKVIPSKPGTQSKIRVGDEVADPKSAPVPESLTIQIPKLRGARFSIDDNGAIVLFAEGSNRVAAVIEPQ
jgi:hypothetical protein